MKNKEINSIIKNHYFKLSLSSFLATTIILSTIKAFGSVPFSISQTTTQKASTFDVSASAKQTIVPTTAKINLGVEIKQKTVKQAQTTANEKINSIVEALKKGGIKEKNIKTTRYNLYPDYDYQNGRSIQGYNISISLEVKTDDFDRLDKIIDLSANLGANQIGQLTFDNDETELEKVKVEARKEAIKIAKEKANEIAKAAGLKLGKIVNVTENETVPSPIYRDSVAMIGGEEASNSTQTQAGENEITVSVTLSFETL